MNNCNLELYTRTDELRARHATFLEASLGKQTMSREPAISLAARTLVCDTMQGETIMPDYKALKKLLKQNRRSLKSIRNKIMSSAMRTGRIELPTKTTTFAGKTDLEILTILDTESAALLTAYDELIAAVKAAA